MKKQIYLLWIIISVLSTQSNAEINSHTLIMHSGDSPCMYAGNNYLVSKCLSNRDVYSRNKEAMDNKRLQMSEGSPTFESKGRNESCLTKSDLVGILSGYNISEKNSSDKNNFMDKLKERNQNYSDGNQNTTNTKEKDICDGNKIGCTFAPDSLKEHLREEKKLQKDLDDAEKSRHSGKPKNGG
ncbi:hypothetical protein ACT42M_11380 [Acinetobacter baumannii]|nr:hypothetical protein [Acinetobacter baumannii]